MAKKTHESKPSTVFDTYREPRSKAEFHGTDISVYFDTDNDLFFDGFVTSSADLRKLHAYLGTLLEPAGGS